MIDVAIVHDVGAFEAMRAEWTELLEASAADSLFLTWEWLFTWWRHCAEGRTLWLVTVRSDGQLVGIAPLALAQPSLARLVPLRTLEFLGTGSVGSDYLDVIARRGFESMVLLALSRRLADHSLIIRLAQLDRTTGLAWELGRQLGQHGWRASSAATEVCPYIDLRGLDWQAYLEGRGAALRYNYRRRLRTLAQQGPVTFERAETPSGRRESLGRLLAFHLRRWDRRGGSDAFHRADLVAFHEELSALALCRGWLRLFTLRVGEKPLAEFYCFRYRDTLLFYQQGFDEQYAKQSVGLIAMGFAIRRAIEERAERFDLLHGRESYKFQWAAQTRELGRLELYPGHPLGWFCRRSVDGQRAAQRTARRLLSASPIHRCLERFSKPASDSRFARPPRTA